MGPIKSSSGGRRSPARGPNGPKSIAKWWCTNARVAFSGDYRDRNSNVIEREQASRAFNESQRRVTRARMVDDFTDHAPFSGAVLCYKVIAAITKELLGVHIVSESRRVAGVFRAHCEGQ